MLNKILFATVQKATTMASLQDDVYEQPAQYKGYILPVRYLLAMRYLKHKRAVLNTFREEGVFPPPTDEFKTRLQERLVKKKTPLSGALSWLSYGATAWFVYPVLLATLAVSGWLFSGWVADQRFEAMLANRLPYYSDLLHRSLMFKYSGYTDAYDKVIVEIKKERVKVHKSTEF